MQFRINLETFYQLMFAHFFQLGMNKGAMLYIGSRKTCDNKKRY